VRQSSSFRIWPYQISMISPQLIQRTHVQRCSRSRRRTNATRNGGFSPYAVKTGIFTRGVSSISVASRPRSLDWRNRCCDYRKLSSVGKKKRNPYSRGDVVFVRNGRWARAREDGTLGHPDPPQPGFIVLRPLVHKRASRVCSEAIPPMMRYRREVRPFMPDPPTPPRAMELRCSPVRCFPPPHNLSTSTPWDTSRCLPVRTFNIVPPALATLLDRPALSVAGAQGHW